MRKKHGGVKSLEAVAFSEQFGIVILVMVVFFGPRIVTSNKRGIFATLFPSTSSYKFITTGVKDLYGVRSRYDTDLRSKEQLI